MTRILNGWSSSGAGHQSADVARQRPCRYGETATVGIGASPGLELADESLVAGLGIQGGSPLAHQLFGHEWMRHRRLLGSGGLDVLGGPSGMGGAEGWVG